MTNTVITKAVMAALHEEFPKASAADLEQIQAARDEKNKGRVLAGVPSADDIRFDGELAERGKKIILDSVRKGAELTREVFLFMRSCEDVDYIEGTFKVAEARAIKALSDGQPEGEPRIKALSDIAKIQGGGGAASYIATKSRLLKIVKNEDELVNGLQQWYNWQQKHSGEPAIFVQPDLLNIWSQRYSNEKTGWSQFTKDARICEQAKASLVSAMKVHERSKGKEAAAQTGQNGEQFQQGMESGTRQRPDISEKVMKSLNEVIRLTHSVSSEVAENELVAILEGCANAMVLLLSSSRAKRENRIPQEAKLPHTAAQSASEGGANPAKADIVGTEQGPSIEAQATGEVGSPSELVTDTQMVKPDWLDQADWDASSDEERYEMMSDKEAYLEEKQLMAKTHEMQDVESNEPTLPEDKAHEG